MGTHVADFCRNPSNSDGNCLPTRPSDSRRTTRLRPRHDPTQVTSVISPPRPSTYTPALSTFPSSSQPYIPPQSVKSSFHLGPYSLTHSLSRTNKNPPHRRHPSAENQNPPSTQTKQTIPPKHSPIPSPLPAPATHQASLSAPTRMPRTIPNLLIRSPRIASDPLPPFPQRNTSRYIHLSLTDPPHQCTRTQTPSIYISISIPR